MSTGFLPDAVIQVHPTLACNLRCGHCYSSSGPGAGRGLDVEAVLAALRSLRGEEYRVVSISGGEPLVYRGLRRLVAGAADLGYRVNLITNGLLLTSERLRSLPALSFVAVSLDGAEARHNAVRGNAGAFTGAVAAMDVLAEAGSRFGVAMSVSSQSLTDVLAVYDVCRARGAALLSLRPLARLGRASGTTDGLGSDDLARLFLTARLLDGLDGGPRVRTDVAPSSWIEASRASAYPRNGDESPLSQIVNPLVVDESGLLLPFVYGVHPRFAIGSIDTVEAVVTDGRPAAIDKAGRLVDTAFRELATRAPRYVDWFAHLAHSADATGHEIPVALGRRTS